MTAQPLVALDVTSLVYQPLSGIQRVVLELVPRLCRAVFARGMAVALVDSWGTGLRALFRWDQPIGNAEIDQALADISTGKALWGAWYHVLRTARALCFGLRALGVEALLRRVPGLPPLARNLRQWLVDWPLRRRRLERLDYYIGFSAGILPNWLPRCLSADRAVLVLHDLIPLHHADYVRPEVTRSFVNNLVELAYGAAGPRCRFLTASTHVADDIRELFWSLCRRRVSVGLLAWGYDRVRFYPDPDPNFRSSLGIAADDFLVLAVSTQDPRKRFGDIETATRLLSRQRSVHGVFIGHGARAAQRDGCIHYLGHLPDDMLRRAYSSCDVFVNWSAAEGFGLPVIEALACGATVIVPPDNPTLLEIGGDEVIVAQEATPESLMRAIAGALTTRRLRTTYRLRSMAREHTMPRLHRPTLDLRRFDWETSCRRIEEELFAETEPQALTLKLAAAA